MSGAGNGVTRGAGNGMASRDLPRCSSLAMLATLLALGLALASGCALGMGSSYIGQWKPRQHVDFEACLREPGPPGARAATECKERKQVITEEPGRRFWGVIAAPLQFGGASTRFRAEKHTRFRFQPNLELLRGEGRWAYGVRAGLMVEPSDQASTDPNDPPGAEVPTFDTFAVDVTAVGHVALLDRLSLYAGAGYLPYSGFAEETSSLGARGLFGLQLALSKTHSTNFIVLSLELDHFVVQYDEGTYRSTGMSGHIGLFF